MTDQTRWLAVLTIVGIVSVEYGGWALLTFVTGREGLTGAQQRFFRDGHAHAGVLLVLSLTYLLWLGQADFSSGLQWLCGGVLALGVMAQSGGFFVQMMQSEPYQPALGTKLTRAGALLIGVALLLLAIGLATV